MFLFVLANELSFPICDFFNQSLSQGDITDCFKESHVLQNVAILLKFLIIDLYLSLLSNLEKNVLRELYSSNFTTFFRNNTILTSFNQVSYQVYLLSPNDLIHTIPFVKR